MKQLAIGTILVAIATTLNTFNILLIKKDISELQAEKVEQHASK